MFLTPEELRELTDRTYAKYQIAWLVENGWKWEPSADGHPKVLRAYAEERMGGKPTARHSRVRVQGLARA